MDSCWLVALSYSDLTRFASCFERVEEEEVAAVVAVGWVADAEHDVVGVSEMADATEDEDDDEFVDYLRN